jgi:lipopolysaccharide transport system ATP-binding protein
MADSVITVESVSKRYTLGAARHDTLRDRIAHALRAPWRHGGATATDPTEFWALRDVSFEVKRGEVLGIVGRNGAGKSTLLKILSRITEPTTGRIRIRGRVASLLEVGTGFHPELTGRENIFLNGAILGMSRAEIHRKFDEIVAFAEVERFLDTPVKHYSSGMYVRLAFAVAAHLEPEILIIDEVLAVGDAQFQKKCLRKVGDVCREGGRTVLFVSHNPAALLNVCQTGLWLQNGTTVRQGPIAETLGAYLQTSGRLEERFVPKADRPHLTFARIDEAALVAGNVIIRAGFTSPFPLSPPVLGITLYNKMGQPISGMNTRMLGDAWRPGAAREGVITVQLDAPPLRSDTYRVSLWLADANTDYDERRDAVEFEFTSRKFYPQTPPVEVLGPVDLPWRLSLAPGENAS